MSKYSLRVELNPIQEKRIKAEASRRHIPMTEVVKQFIDSLDFDIDYELSRLKQTYPLLVKKLRYWGIKRLHHAYSAIGSQTLEIVDAEIDLMLSEIALAKDRFDLINAVNSWDSKLSVQEKQCLSELFPFHSDSELKIGWNWYALGEGDYSTAKEQLVLELEESIITKNKYDAFIMNCNNMMFVDVDLTWEANTREPKSLVISSENVALRTLEAVAEEYSLKFLAYRTAGGLRYICVNRKFTPSSSDSKNIMRALFCDPRYMLLCDRQGTYRARLTPKPWRIDSDCLPDNIDDKFWMDRYAVCHYSGEYGTGKTLSEFLPLINFHDEMTNVKDNLEDELELV